MRCVVGLSVPQRGTLIDTPVQARNERSAGIVNQTHSTDWVTRGVTIAHRALTSLYASWPLRTAALPELR